MPDEKLPARCSSACACVIAAARALEAVEMWKARLTPDDQETVRRWLQKRQEWRALEFWTKGE